MPLKRVISTCFYCLSLYFKSLDVGEAAPVTLSVVQAVAQELRAAAFAAVTATYIFHNNAHQGLTVNQQKCVFP